MNSVVKSAAYAKSFLKKGLVHTNLQILYDCNFRCRICDFWRSSKGGAKMSVPQIKVISKKLAAIGPQIVSIGGGEPLMHPELIGIVKVLAEDHFPVMICNGWFVTPKNATALFDAGVMEVSISIDYADAAKHDEQRGVDGAFSRAMASLKILNESRRSPWQRVHMISVVMDDNLADIEKLARLCAEMGITYLVTLYSDARGSKTYKNIAPDISDHLLSLKKRYPGFVSLRGYVKRFSKAVRESGVRPCYAGKNLCNIDNNGDVSLCIDRMNEPVGNLLTDNPFEIEGRLLRRHNENRCASCWTSCRGSIESIMYGGEKAGNLVDYWRMVRPYGVAPR